MIEDENAKQGFNQSEPGFEAERDERARLVDAFLATMEKAGNPGTARQLGSLLRQLTGQHEDRYWEIKIEGDEDGVLVFADGRHGWESNFVKSDRPISLDAEIPPARLADALRAILDANDLPRPEELR